MPGDDDETNLMPALAAVDLRRVDIDAKQAQVAALLADCQSEGLLVLHPANFRWLTAGANPSGLCYVCAKCGYIHWFLPQ